MSEYDAKDLAVRHAAATRADSIGFQGVLLEKDGSVTGTDGHILVNVSRTLMGNRDSTALVDSAGVKDAVARSKALKSPVAPDVAKEIVFDWRGLLPDGDPRFRIVVTAETLTKLIKAATDALDKKTPLTLEFRGEHDPVVVRGEHEDRSLLALVATRYQEGLGDG